MVDPNNVRPLAERIARRLFTNGSQEVADRLVLVKGEKNRELGGWAYEPAVDQIVAILRSALA